jgi:hypothetical protein
MLSFSIVDEQRFNPKSHVESILGTVAGGDVSVACWEPGQISPNHCHPNATEIYFVSRVAASCEPRTKLWRLLPARFWSIRLVRCMSTKMDRSGRFCSECAMARIRARDFSIGAAIQNGSRQRMMRNISQQLQREVVLAQPFAGVVPLLSVTIPSPAATRTGTKSDAGSFAIVSAPVRACFRHTCSKFGWTSCRRATSVTPAPGARVSTTIRAFSTELQRRRRSGPGKTVTVDIRVPINVQVNGPTSHDPAQSVRRPSPDGYAVYALIIVLVIMAAFSGIALFAKQRPMAQRKHELGPPMDLANMRLKSCLQVSASLQPARLPDACVSLASFRGK